MGVPSFARWLFDNYPEYRHLLVLEELHQDVDTIYIDANGIFHPISFETIDYYPDWKDVDWLHQKMFHRICLYLDYLITIVNPQKEVFISVDGVAPMAKMNQQRKRRFRSVDDQRISDEIKRRHGRETTRNWSNTVITPGTEYMEQLMNHLREYCKKLKARRPDLRVTLSTYHVPGEGEHKILTDIRTKNKDPANADATYVIHGLDADLIFLALSTNRQNIFLMREARNLGPMGKDVDGSFIKDPDDLSRANNFVSIDVMKKAYLESLDNTITEKAELLGLEYAGMDTDEEKARIMSDFIFICFFMGNDFLPHIPSLSIRYGGLDRIIDYYAELYLLSRGGHILEFEMDEDVPVSVRITDLVKPLVEKLTEYEPRYYTVDMPKHMEQHRRRRCFASNPYDREVWLLENMKSAVIDDPIRLGEGTKDEWTHRYYAHHFDVTGDQTDIVKSLCHNYFEGLQWVSTYYFVGCPDWRWQYRYCHSPLLSDLATYMKGMDSTTVEHSMNPPLNPCSQLLAVLPPSCSHLLPRAYHPLVTSIDSPVIDLYPTSVKIDPVNQVLRWQCVPRLVYVPADRILGAISGLSLTKKEAVRNSTQENDVY